MENMIILASDKRVDLVVDMNNVENGIFVRYQNRLYETRYYWRCISGENQFRLYKHIRFRAMNLMDTAKMRLAEIIKMKEEESIVEKTVVKNIEIPTTIAETAKNTENTVVKRNNDEIRHSKFNTVLNLVKNNIPVFLSGPAGTGKNVLCKQIADELGLEFYFTNCVTTEFKITGFINANGIYEETSFYKAFTKGGLFFIDEIDASTPEALIILNSAIANGYIEFPNGKAVAHKNFRVIAAGNTYGSGADNEYVGRNQLDAASLDRFAMIVIDYERAIEEKISGGNMELVEFAHAFREVCKFANIVCLFTYRAIDRIAKLEKDIDLKELLEIALLKGIGKDDIKIIASKIKVSNKYSRSLSRLAA